MMTLTEKSCKNCIEMKKGDCFGQNSICESYKHSPVISEEKRKDWPKYGDATMFKLSGR